LKQHSPQVRSKDLPPVSPERIRTLFAGVLAAAIIGGAVRAWFLRYVNDDAFISFRYAKNFVNGLGLVYNIGEKVEGYTNVLWTLLMALGMKAGADPVSTSIGLGIFFYVLTLLLFGYLSWTFRRAGTAIALTLPITTLALCLNRDFSLYATSGLETSMNAFFISAGFAALLLSGSSKKKLLLAGLMLTLAMFARPDSALFLAAGTVYCLLAKKERIRSSFFILLPAIFLYVPYWLWRWNYYGYFFPNTFYAKSIDLPYWSQGFLYAQMFFETYYVFVLLPTLGAILWWRWRRAHGKESNATASPWNHFRAKADQPFPLLLISLFAGLDLFFIIRIGGDFMFARFFVAMIPILYFGIEYAGGMIGEQLPTLALFVIVGSCTLLRVNLFGNGYIVDGIADECQIYTMEDLAGQQSRGDVLKKYLHDLPVTLAFTGGQARLVYYSEVANAIETSTGLTDAHIAHQALEKRGRPGHEKAAEHEYVEGRGANFIVGKFKNSVDAISFDDVTARIIVYDNSLMARLQNVTGIKFAPFPDYLDWYIQKLPSLPRQQVKENYDFFKKYYFDHNGDSVRNEVFVSFLSRLAR
jgi:hypothetical protein